MKKSTFTLTAFLLFVTFCLNAQVTIGLRTGYVRAHQDYGDVELPEDAKIHIHGLQVSVLSQFDLNRFLSFHFEPGFIRRGAACEPGFLVFNSDTRLLLDYVEFPFLISVWLPACDNSIEWFLKTGYSVSRLHSGFREQRAVGSDEPVFTDQVPIGGGWGARPWDHGVHVGFGFGYFLGKGKLLLDISLYGGFENIIRSNTSKNVSGQIGIGYTYSI